MKNTAKTKLELYRLPEDGVALLELIIILPVLTFIILFSIESALAMRKFETISVLSREVSNSAIRECLYSADPQTCINNVRVQIETWGNNLHPGLKVVLSMYNYDKESNTYTRRAYSSDGSYSSKLDLHSFNGESCSDLNKLIKSYKTLVVGEVYLSYMPVLFNLQFQPFYEVTIF